MSDLGPDQLPEGWNKTSKIYDEKLRDFMAPWIQEVVARAEPTPSHEVLDIGAGPGGVSLAIAPKVERVLAIDFAKEMLARLEQNARQEGAGNVTTELMDGQDLKLDDETFDIVCSNFGVIFYPDRASGFSEMRRVLRPGGRAVFTAWSTPDRFESFSVLMEAIKRALPDFPAPSSPPPLFSLSDPERIEAELREAGFSDVRIETARHTLEEEDMKSFWENIQGSAPPVLALFEKLGSDAVGRVEEALLEIERERFSDGVSLTNEAHITVATR